MKKNVHNQNERRSAAIGSSTTSSASKELSDSQSKKDIKSSREFITGSEDRNKADQSLQKRAVRRDTRKNVEKNPIPSKFVQKTNRNAAKELQLKTLKP